MSRGGAHSSGESIRTNGIDLAHGMPDAIATSASSELDPVDG